MPTVSTVAAWRETEEPAVAMSGADARGRAAEWWRTTGLEQRLTALAAFVLGLAVLAGSVTALVRGWAPIADEAFMEMRVRDVPSNVPLLGVYSRFGWNHPGPVQFLLLAVPYRLLGSASAALLAGSLVLHLVAAWALLRIGRRLDPLTGSLLFTLTLVAMLATPADDLRTPWNPFVGLVTTVLLVAAAWGVAERHRLASLVLIPLASLLVQVHLVNAFLVIGAGVAAATLVWTHPRNASRDGAASDEQPVEPGPPVRWRELGIGAGVAAVMWIPPLVALVLGRPGSLADLLRNGSGDGATAGLATALGATFDAFALVPTWARTSTWTQGFALTEASVPVWFLVAAVGALLAYRRRDATFLRGFAVAGICLIAAVIGAAQLRNGFFAYLLVALRGSAIALTALGLGSVARSLPDHLRRRALPVLAVAATCVAFGIGVRQVVGENPGAEYRPAVDLLTDAVLAAPIGDDPLVLSGSLYFEAAPALALQLERAGVDVVLEERDLELAVGAHRLDDGTGDRTEVRVGPLAGAQEARHEGWTVLAEYEVFTDAERRRVAGLTERLAELTAEYDRLVAGRGANRARTNDVLRRAVDLNTQIREIVGGRIEVFVASRSADQG